MELRLLELRRLIELWAAWYSIGVDGCLATDESTHSCTLELPNPIASNGNGSFPPYLPDLDLDRVLLRALNRFGLQCSRRGNLSFGHSGSGEEITHIGEPIVAMLEVEHRFFTGKHIYLYSELRRDYGDFGSHIMAMEFTVQERRASIRHISFDANNQRRGLKLNLWSAMQRALAAYEEIFEQAAALGHSLMASIADAATPLQSGFPFPCQSESEASHLARLSRAVAPMRKAVAEGAILTSSHTLRELAALITFARFCEPAGVILSH